MSSEEPLRIANCSGFYGDRFAAAREMVEGGPIDVLTGDYLAELTMLILWKSAQRDPALGYATTFYRQMEEVLGTCVERGIKVVANAGGLNPAGLAERLRELAAKLGIDARVSHVEGDDILRRIPEMQAAGEDFAHLDTGRLLSEAPSSPVTANAYLGGFGIAEALSGGADVVVTGRVTDAALVVGPCIWHFGWERDDWDRLAGAVVAGHVIECGAQATGGNYAFFHEVPGLDHPGFPIAEMRSDGSAVVTKHPGSGGLVSVGTVTAQLLYEIAGPLYANPDVVADFSTIRLSEAGPDRVAISGTRGLPAPNKAKACLNLIGGWRNSMTFVLTGLDIEEKARAALQGIERTLGGTGHFESFETLLVRSDKPDAPSEAEASAELRVTVKGSDQATIGRAFSRAVTEIALASYPGFHLTSLPRDATAYGVYWPALVDASKLAQVVVHHDGRRVEVPPAPAVTAELPWATGISAGSGAGSGAGSPPASPPGATRRLPLGKIAGARSGDKGGNANVGVWARTPEAYEWLAGELTPERFRELVPETGGQLVDRYELPNLLALNFVVRGILGEGVASSTRPDPQAKALGEYLRSRMVEIPERLIP